MNNKTPEQTLSAEEQKVLREQIYKIVSGQDDEVVSQEQYQKAFAEMWNKDTDRIMALIEPAIRQAKEEERKQTQNKWIEAVEKSHPSRLDLIARFTAELTQKEQEKEQVAIKEHCLCGDKTVKCYGVMLLQQEKEGDR